MYNDLEHDSPIFGVASSDRKPTNPQQWCSKTFTNATLLAMACNSSMTHWAGLTNCLEALHGPVIAPGCLNLQIP
jgi:hypothetical protein